MFTHTTTPGDADETVADWRADLVCTVHDILTQDLKNLQNAAAVYVLDSELNVDITGQSLDGENN